MDKLKEVLVGLIASDIELKETVDKFEETGMKLNWDILDGYEGILNKFTDGKYHELYEEYASRTVAELAVGVIAEGKMSLRELIYEIILLDDYSSHFFRKLGEVKDGLDIFFAETVFIEPLLILRNISQQDCLSENIESHFSGHGLEKEALIDYVLLSSSDWESKYAEIMN